VGGTRCWHDFEPQHQYESGGTKKSQVSSSTSVWIYDTIYLWKSER